MFTRCNPGTVMSVPCTGKGGGVTLFVSQEANDPGGHRISLFSIHGGRPVLQVRMLVPARTADRPADYALFVGGAPGASGWRAEVEVVKAATEALLVGVACEERLLNPTLMGAFQS